MKAPSEETEGRAPRRSPKMERTQGLVDPRGELPTDRRAPGRRRWYILAGAVLLAAAVVLLVRRSSDNSQAPAPSPSVVMEGSRIRFTEEFATRHHVGSEKARESELSPTIQVLGNVEYDLRKFAAIGARSAGRIRRVVKIAGDHVKPGELLADIESVELGKAQAAAESLRARELAAKTNFEREQRLAEAKVTAMREAEAARAEYQALHAERRAAERAVTAMGARVNSEVGILPVRTPIAGRVIMSKASRGLTVEPSDTLFEVADLSTVWVELMIFERDLDRVHEGDEVEIMPTAAKGEALQGKLAHLAHTVDPETRSAVGRVEVDNRHGWLRPGQSINARIHTQGTGAPAVTVPRSSVTFIDGKPTALVLTAPGVVEPRPLELGAEDGQHVIVREGLRAGETVITEGLFALKSEIFR